MRELLPVDSSPEVRSSDNEEQADREGKVRNADVSEMKGKTEQVDDRQVRLIHFKTKVQLLKSPGLRH